MFSAEGAHLVAAGTRELRVFDLRGSALPGYRLENEGEGFLGVACDPKERYVAFSTLLVTGREEDRSGSVGILDLSTGETAFPVEPRAVFGRDTAVTPISIAFHPEGEYVACSFNDGSLRMWARGSWRERVMRGPSEDWRAITFSPDGARIWAWTGSSSGIGVFDPARPGWLLTLPVGGGDLGQVAFDDVHQRLLATSGDSKRLLFLSSSLEKALPLWRGIAKRERTDLYLETRVDAVLVSEARAEIQGDASVTPEWRQRLSSRLDWIGNPTPDELSLAAWRVVDPSGPRRGDVRRALRDALAAVALEPDLPEHRETAGWAYFANGRYDLAEQEALEAVRLAEGEMVVAFQQNLAELRAQIREQRR